MAPTKLSMTITVHVRRKQKQKKRFTMDINIINFLGTEGCWGQMVLVGIFV
jgi:hypothetical protein